MPSPYYDKKDKHEPLAWRQLLTSIIMAVLLVFLFAAIGPKLSRQGVRDTGAMGFRLFR